MRGEIAAIVRTVVLYFVGPPIVLLAGVYGASAAIGVEFKTILVWLTIPLPIVWIFTFGAVETPTSKAKGSYPGGSSKRNIDSAELRTGTRRSASIMWSYATDLVSSLPLVLTVAVILGWIAVVTGFT